MSCLHARVAPLLLAWLLLPGCPAHREGERHLNTAKLGRGGTEAAASDCVDDAREPDDSIPQVLGKILSGPKVFVINDEVSCPGDDDYFHGYADGVSAAGAIVTWKASEGELRVDLLDSRGTVMRLEGADTEDRAPGRIELKRDHLTGDFYVRVRNYAGTRIPYAIEIAAPAAE